ncbi:MAG TPA: hypothetical protein VG408_01545 [Actinomycetota bacterium]|nr:hypothetical protein [Actinomycetota bacterium]
MNCTNPNGCTLEATEMVERIAAWREISSKAISRDVAPDRITSVYPSDPDIVRRLRALIEAEAECCTFLRFTIEERSAETTVQLSFPEDARPLIEAVMSAS